jgi:hypothetical protein
MPSPGVSAARDTGIAGRARWGKGVVLAACFGSGILAAFSSGQAAPPGRSRPGPVRFFEGMFKSSRPEPTPAFIPLPIPPDQSEVDRLQKQAAQRQRSQAARTRGGSGADKLPSWEETSGFFTAARDSAGKIFSDALARDYQPAPRPPETVTVRPRTANPGVVPLVVTRLEPSGMPAPATPRFERLRKSIDQTLGIYQRRPLNTAQHTPWEVMHGLIAFGIPTQIRLGGPAGDLVSAIGWSNSGGVCRGQTMLTVTGDRLHALKGYYGVQGHSAQYLAILAQCRVAATSPMVVRGKRFTVNDLIEEEKLACKSGTELTFSLIALAHYLPTDATWQNREGETWSLERLVEEEIVQPIRGAACGGTHRLFGLSYGCQRRLRATGELDGAYLRADRYVRDFQNFTVTKLQNRDGSFSTEWFKYPADREDDVDRKIQTTGHILEWLVGSLDQEQLYDPRVVAAAEFLCRSLSREPSREWKIGPLGHALHSLNMYQERAWGVVLPGGIAAFHGPMKASQSATLVAEEPAAAGPTLRR